MKTKITEDVLRSLVKENISIRQVVIKLGLNANGGGNNHHVKSLILKYGIDTRHFLGQAANGGVRHIGGNKGIKLEDILVENSNYTRQGLKRRLLNKGIITNRCGDCGITEWNGKKLVMVLDHKNGIHNDNRLENLRMLCPNCNSQQDTFAGRNARKNKPE